MEDASQRTPTPELISSSFNQFYGCLLRFHFFWKCAGVNASERNPNEYKIGESIRGRGRRVRFECFYSSRIGVRFIIKYGKLAFAILRLIFARQPWLGKSVWTAQQWITALKQNNIQFVYPSIQPELSHKQPWQERRIWLLGSTKVVKHLRFIVTAILRCLTSNLKWSRCRKGALKKKKIHDWVMWNYVAMEPSLFIVIVSAVVRWVCLHKSCGCNVNSDCISSMSAKSTLLFFSSNFIATERLHRLLRYTIILQIHSVYVVKSLPPLSSVRFGPPKP